MPVLFFYSSMYEQEILSILTKVGDGGIAVGKLSRHVFNERNSLFDDIAYDDVYRAVGAFLRRESISTQGLVERMERRGYYRLNTHSAQARTLMLNFLDDQEKPTVEETAAVDLSLSLFGDEANEE